MQSRFALFALVVLAFAAVTAHAQDCTADADCLAVAAVCMLQLAAKDLPVSVPFWLG